MYLDVSVFVCLVGFLRISVFVCLSVSMYGIYVWLYLCLFICLFDSRFPVCVYLSSCLFVTWVSSSIRLSVFKFVSRMLVFYLSVCIPVSLVLGFICVSVCLSVGNCRCISLVSDCEKHVAVSCD